jgi:hypothetical protein
LSRNPTTRRVGVSRSASTEATSSDHSPAAVPARLVPAPPWSPSTE